MPRRASYGVSYDAPEPVAFHRDNTTDEELDPPRLEEWRQLHVGEDAGYVWRQPEGAAPSFGLVSAWTGSGSGFSISIHQGNQIDSTIRILRSNFPEDNLSVESTTVEGASRAVRASSLSMSGDVSAQALYAEAGGMTVEVSLHYFWIDQLNSDIVEKLSSLLDSVTIEPEGFPEVG